MSQSLLFFDEADSLFGRRTEVKDAHDRYANLEVNYLLQRIEQYEGLVILATNMQRNLDDAFLRRMQEVIDFPFPNEALRERIWRQHVPPNAPVDALASTTGFLARQFKLTTGGSIKNAVMTAAFLAASHNKEDRDDRDDPQRADGAAKARQVGDEVGLWKILRDRTDVAGNRIDGEELRVHGRRRGITHAR